jgi:hypothetical protein
MEILDHRRDFGGHGIFSVDLFTGHWNFAHSDFFHAVFVRTNGIIVQVALRDRYWRGGRVQTI